MQSTFTFCGWKIEPNPLFRLLSTRMLSVYVVSVYVGDTSLLTPASAHYLITPLDEWTVSLSRHHNIRATKLFRVTPNILTCLVNIYSLSSLQKLVK